MRTLIAVSAGSPVGLVRKGFSCRREGNRFHHLAEQTVCQDHSWNAVFIGLVKCLHDSIYHFLNGTGCEYQNMEVAVSHCMGCLIVVGLCRLNGTQFRAAALYVDDNSRQIRASHIGNTLCLQRNSRRGRGGHCTHASGGCAQYHVYSGDF